jgi:anthranilate phosphoribosyltransferase
MVIDADDGLDELSVTSPSTVLELNRTSDADADADADDGGTGAGFEVTEWRVDPAELGLAPATLADLRGGDAAFNAAAIRSVLAGDSGANRDIGLLNAAAALMVAGAAADLPAGIALAAESLDRGRAATALDSLVTVSQQALADEVAAAGG